MARIRSYARDTNITNQDRILGSSYEGILNNQPIYKTKNYKLTDLAAYFSQNFDFEGVNYDLAAINDYWTNLANSLGNVNEDGSLANISVTFANDLVAVISTVPNTFTELALSNLSAIPQAFADFLFTIADINEEFANQVLDLSTSTAYAQLDTFNALSAFVDQIDTSVQGLDVDVTNLTAATNTNTGAITANATAITALGVRTTTAEADVLALQTDFTSLETVVNTNTGNISTNATSISTLGTVVDTATTDIATLKTDVTLLESEINTLSGDVTANASNISLLTTNVSTITADVTALDTDITTLTTTVNTNTGDIATAANDISLLANRVTTTESNISNTQTDVTSLTTTVNGNTGNISTNASNISILQTNVSTAQTDITGIITDIQQIETDINNVTGDVTANATAISGLGTRVTTTESDITNVQGNITTLQTNLNTQTGRIDTNVNNISTLSTTVTNNFTTLQGAITTVDNARISGDSALTSSITSLTSTVTNNNTTLTAAVQTNANTIATVDGKLSASYGITVDAGGRVAGLKLLADGTTGSEFIARANTFAVDMPNGTRVLTVNSSGLSVVGSGTFSGNISGSSGTFNGVTINSSGITGPNFTLNSSGLTASNATISGNITITSGTTLNAITAAQDTADTAINDASTAQGTADTAINNAATAQSTANTANTTANTALSRTVSAAGKITFNPAPSGSGLFMNATNLGYYDGGAWKTYMQNNGNFFLSGSGSNGLSWDGTTLTVNGSGTFTGTLDAGLVNIASNIVTFGAADSAYSQTGKIRFNNYLGTQIGELSTSSGIAGGAPRSTITLETLGNGTGLDPVLSMRGGYGWDIGDSGVGTVYGYHTSGVTKLNLFADQVLLNSGPFLSSTGYQRIWGNFTIQWVRRTWNSGTNTQQFNAPWPTTFTSIFGAVVSRGYAFSTYDTQNNGVNVSYTTERYYVDTNDSTGGTVFIIALGMIADPT